MAVHTFQVTIAAGTRTRVTTGAGLASRIPCRQVTFQNNSANVCRVGDVTVTSSIGNSLPANNAANSVITFGPFNAQNVNLEDFYIAGTQNGLIDGFYVS